MERLHVAPSAFCAGDVVYEPEPPHARMYRVVQVRTVHGHRTLVHVMYRDGDELRWLPNSVTYPIDRGCGAVHACDCPRCLAPGADCCRKAAAPKRDGYRAPWE